MRRYSPNIRADQLELYWTSQHGRSLKKGNARVAVCTDCHGVHGIKDAKSPKSMIFPWNIPQTCGRCHADKAYMATSAIPTNQLEDYKQSVHAQALFEKKDLSAPACNDCHGNHGAQPPGVASIAFVCRQCHPSAGDLFSQSPHKAAYDALDISECEACHGNHKILRPSDEMLGTAEKAVCIQCHDPGSKPFEAALAMKQKIDDIRTRIESAEILLEKAEKRGVEVSEPKFKLQEARTNLIFIRNLTHGLSLEEITEKAGEGTAVIAEVQKAGDDALREARFRRSGLFVTNAFIILLAVALFLKIRQMKRRPSPQK
jgi:predicted CXXCH cytochrome family protein